jgi:hypothetical protein
MVRSIISGSGSVSTKSVPTKHLLSKELDCSRTVDFLCINDFILRFISNLIFFPSSSTSLSFNYALASWSFNLKLPHLGHNIIDLAKNPIDLVSVGLADESNIYDWEILIMGPDGTLYEGGFFKARLVFPPDFPNMPRK